MKLRIRQATLHLTNVRTRMPFRYGIAAMTEASYAFVRIELDINGEPHGGLAADVLPPKWFTKNPDTLYEEDVKEMIEVIRSACRLATGAAGGSLFELWSHIYTEQKQWAAPLRYPPLLWGFGVSLVERAMIDACCRGMGMTLAEALRGDELGFDLVRMYAEHADEPLPAEVAEAPLADVLPGRPLESIIARHTIGLGDPLTDDEIAPAEKLADGLPQSLEACIHAYGLTHFKIKLFGDVQRDRERLARMAAIIGRACPEYAFTLDGNENYRQLAPFRELWQHLLADRSLGGFMSRLLFVEQPLHRDVALSDATRTAMRRWTARPPTIIDESDGEIGSVRRALDCGYAGTSHKNCKGISKGLANAAVIAHRRRSGKPAILSGEDLTNIGPVALLQDLAMMASLGIEHVERNGHHYFAGLSMWPTEIQEVTRIAHPELYHRLDNGLVPLRIARGRIDCRGTVEAPFGYAAHIDVATFTPLE